MPLNGLSINKQLAQIGTWMIPRAAGFIIEIPANSFAKMSCDDFPACRPRGNPDQDDPHQK